MTLPWRGPGPGRPQDIPLPPERMRLRRGGCNLKRWRYVGAFSDQLLLCAARIQVGPLGQSFWAIWDREEGELHERTRFRFPGGRGEVFVEEEDGGPVDRIEAPGARAFLRFGDGEWAESVCPNGSGEYVWTRKRVDVPVRCDVRLGERRLRMDARGVEDESAGYHARHTVWSWSAGVGRARDGRSVGWNLVSGINDPPRSSERAIWVDGDPFEPEPVSFEGLEAIGFSDGSRLRFAAECERQRQQNMIVARYSYRQPFGTFSGTLPGGLEIESGLGVMEHHDAVW